jgi:hypothetical protein
VWLWELPISDTPGVDLRSPGRHLLLEDLAVDLTSGV